MSPKQTQFMSHPRQQAGKANRAALRTESHPILKFLDRVTAEPGTIASMGIEGSQLNVFDIARNTLSNMDMSLPPLSQDSHGPWMIWSSWALTGLASVFLGLRCYCRASRNKSLWWDDYVLILSWLFLVASAINVTYNVTQGFGQHIYNLDPRQIPSVGLLAQVDLIFAILGAAWSKTSWGITLLRLSKGLLHHVVLCIIISVNFLMSLSIVFNFIQCIPSRKLWEPYLEGACWPKQIVPIYSTVSGAYSGAMDITLALLPWFLIMKVNMRLAERIGVAVAMSCGIFAGATAFVKTAYVINLGSKDPIYDTAPLVVWSHAEIAVTIVAASIPVLRVLAKDVSLSSILSALHTKRSQGKSTTTKTHKSGGGPSRGSSWLPLQNTFSSKGTTSTALSSSMATTTTCSANPADPRRKNAGEDDKGYDGSYANTLSATPPERGRGMSRDGSSERELLPMVP
ncbi:hypothetical protein PG993_000432 [Apiospora rasikravindrae]|uniref:Rhodopsin domain-containing protein n=1 Tax=Apiospora rasikravindrae TaxID=990691 RepID=A0ABR1UAV6_9PEZI